MKSPLGPAVILAALGYSSLVKSEVAVTLTFLKTSKPREANRITKTIIVASDTIPPVAVEYSVYPL